MKMNLPQVSQHAKPITSRAELEQHLVEQYNGSSQVKFSVLTEHRLFGDKMVGWWDPKLGKGELYGDAFAVTQLNESEQIPPAVEAAELEKQKGLVQPQATPATDRPLNEGDGKDGGDNANKDDEGDDKTVEEAKAKLQTLNEGRADRELLEVLTS